jgi:hypothetical protein
MSAFITSLPRPLGRTAAIAAIGILAMGAGFGIQHTKPRYTQSASVLFVPPARYASAKAYSWLGPALIATGQLISQIVMGPQAQAEIRDSGGTASYNMTLVNLYNQDYPDYSYPEATLSTSSPEAATAGRTFALAARLVGRVLADRQAEAGVAPPDRIVARLIAVSGPIRSAGSRKRALGGVLLLAIVACSWAWTRFSRSAAPGGRHWAAHPKG